MGAKLFNVIEILPQPRDWKQQQHMNLYIKVTLFQLIAMSTFLIFVQ